MVLVLRLAIGRLLVMVSRAGARGLGLLRAAADNAVHANHVAVTLLIEQVPPPALRILEHHGCPLRREKRWRPKETSALPGKVAPAQEYLVNIV
jgi:hypothetical protein